MNHPVQFSVDYPDRPLNRLTTGLRIFTLIPIAIVFAVTAGAGGGGSGILFLPVLLMLLFREKYPRWWFDWNLGLQSFANRVGAYALLLDDRYPSTDEAQSVHLEYVYPDARTELNRWLPLVKWFLAIPHYLVLLVLYIGVLFGVIAAWFAILFTGRYPRGIFDFVVGAMRWHNRVVAYAFTLVTDRYPPFSLRP